jgi:four helix bundle protein
MTSYKELKVWRESVELVKDVYIATKLFPKEELYVLVSQIRRAAISIPSNIAEGHMRKGTREFVQFAQVALGSAAELDTQLVIARELNYLTTEAGEQVMNRLDHVSRMLNKLIFALERRIKTRIPEGTRNPNP